MKDIWLLGNLTIDHIMECKGLQPGKNNVADSRFHRMGGLANIVPALEGLDIGMSAVVGDDWNELGFDDPVDRCNLKFRDGRSSISHIITHDGERTSFTDWGAGVNGGNIYPEEESRWTHIAYLDVLQDIDVFDIKKRSKGLISADLCISDPGIDKAAEVIGGLGGVDLLFLSEGELSGYGKTIGIESVRQASPEQVEEFREFCGVKSLVYHWRDGAIVSTDKGTWISPEWVRSAYRGDTIGAGDLFAGCVLKSLLVGDSLHDAVNDAHEKTGDLLRERGGKR